MNRREAWVTALLIAAALCAWAYHASYGAYRAAAFEDLLLYVGIPADSVAFWFLVVALLSGSVVIYTQHDEYHYKRVHDAPEISRWPRFKDQNCRLATRDELQLTCGDKTLLVSPD